MAGSLTQTSMLHCRRGFPLSDRLAASMAVVQSTSPHYWFLASLDSARQQLALHGSDLLESALSLARYVRQEINAIPGLSSFGRDIVDGVVVTGFDETKITIDFSGVGLDGIEAEKCLRREGIEVELVAGNHVLALITLGDTKETAQSLVDAAELLPQEKLFVQLHPVMSRPFPCPRLLLLRARFGTGRWNRFPSTKPVAVWQLKR